MVVASIKTFLRSDRSRVSRWAAAAAALLMAGSALAAGTNTYKFTNKEAEKAHDLHIEFDAAVTWDTTDATYSWQNPAGTFKSALVSGATVNLAVGVGGTGVDKGKSLDLTFAFAGADFPQVKKWWWTKEGGGILGVEKQPAKQTIKFEYVSAGGGGRYLFFSHGETMIFQTIPGEPSTAAVQRLAQQINATMHFARANPVPSARMLTFQGTAFDWTCDDFRVMVQSQDMAGPLTVTAEGYCPADLNGDGVVDFADYLEFLNLFEQQDPSVDFNGDGLVDFADYLEFLNRYEQGCAEPQLPCGT